MSLRDPWLQKPMEFLADDERLREYAVQAWYPGAPTGARTLRDWTRNGNHGTLTNFASPFTATSGWGAGYQGGRGALYYDGTNDNVTSFGTSISPVGSRTILALVKVSTTSRIGICGTRPSAATTGFSFTVNRTTAGNLTYFHVGGTLIEKAAGITVGSWFHVAVVLDTLAATATLFCNGRSLGTTTSFSAETSSAFTGVLGDENGGFDTPLNGALENVIICNRALTIAQVKSISDNPWLLRLVKRVTYFVPAAATGNRRRRVLICGGN